VHRRGGQHAGAAGGGAEEGGLAAVADAGRPTRAGAAMVRTCAGGLLICDERGQLTGPGVSANSVRGHSR
jgi:hypothetical protein